MAFEVVEDQDTEDYYVITLSFRPQGQFTGIPGQEQFFIEKEGVVAHRQVLSLPLPPGGGRFPIIPAVIGLAVVAAVFLIAWVFFVGNKTGDIESPVIDVTPRIPSQASTPAVPVVVTSPSDRPAMGQTPFASGSLPATPAPLPTPTAIQSPSVPVLEDLGIVPNTTDDSYYVWVLHEGPDGRIYGGSSGWQADQGTTFFIYDPSTNDFSEKGAPWETYTPPGSLVTGSDGNVYLATNHAQSPGGVTGEQSFSVYDPSSGALDTIKSLRGGDVHITSGKGGKIYGSVITECCNTGANASTLFSYDPATGVFAENLADITGFVSAMAAAPDGKIYGGAHIFHGGSNLFVYDPISGTVADKGLLWPTDDSYHVSSLDVASDGKVYGTTDGAGGDATGGGRMFAFDPSTDLVTDFGEGFEGARNGVRLAVGPDGLVYIGGPGGPGVSLLAYDPSTGATSLVGRDTSGSSWGIYSMAVTSGGDIYLGTGGDGRLLVRPAVDEQALSVKGQVVASANEAKTSVDTIRLSMTTPGQASDPVDLSNTGAVVTYLDTSQAINCMNPRRFVHESFTPECSWSTEWIIGSGDLVEPGEQVDLTVTLTNLSPPLGGNKEFAIQVKPNDGAAVIVNRTTPADLKAIMLLN